MQNSSLAEEIRAVDTGGPAFPSATEYRPSDGQPMSQGCYGMYLRDWFAGQAMVGIIANQEFFAEVRKLGLKHSSGGLHGSVATVAHAFADAMLAERAKALSQE